MQQRVPLAVNVFIDCHEYGLMCNLCNDPLFHYGINIDSNERESEKALKKCCKRGETNNGAAKCRIGVLRSIKYFHSLALSRGEASGANDRLPPLQVLGRSNLQFRECFLRQIEP